MSGEKVVAICTQSLSLYNMNWPEHVLNEQLDTHTELMFMMSPNGIKITRGQSDRTYYITFFKYRYFLNEWWPIITKSFPITFDQIFSMRNLDRKQILLQFSSYFTTQQLPKRCKWCEFKDYEYFSLHWIYRSGVKSARIRVLALIYYEICRDLDKLQLRKFTWLCVSTIHMKSLPKDVRKLICNFI